MNSTRSIKDEMGEAEWAVRVELAAAYRVFDMLGWTHLIHTHITAGVPGGNGPIPDQPLRIALGGDHRRFAGQGRCRRKNRPPGLDGLPDQPGRL